MPSGEDNQSDPDDGPVLSPDDLDITDDDHVREIDESRFVISPNEPFPSESEIGVPSDAAERETEDAPSRDDGSSERAPPELDERAVEEWLYDHIDEADSMYGFYITAKFDDSIDHQHLFSNDVVTVFENLLLWSAQQAGGNTPVDEVLGILLTESSVPIRYPTKSIHDLLATHGLSPDDSIAALLKAIDDDGVTFPPKRNSPRNE